MSTGRMALIGLVILAILALIFLGFCRPPGTTEEPKATSTAKASGTTAPKTAATTGAPSSAGATTPAAATKAAPNSSELAAALESYKKAEFKITYEMSGAGFPAGATMVISQSGAKSRTEFSISGQTMTMIAGPDKSYMCIAEQRTCLDAAAAGAFGGAFANPVATGLQSFSNAAPTGLKQAAGRTIAGVAARCFEGTDVTQGTGTVCVGPEGQLLSIDGTGQQGSFKLTATKVEGKPAASDFEAPYPVTTIPGGLGGPGGFPGGLPTPPNRP